MIQSKIIVCVVALFLCACSSTTDTGSRGTAVKVSEAIVKDRARRPYAIDSGKIFEKDGRKLLYGGESEGQHFDISDWTLKEGQLHYGIGREAFPALLEPVFMDRAAASLLFPDTSRFLLLNMEGVVKAYSIKDLIRHEVVNDQVNGKPIMAAYCILADLGAVYDREIEGRTYTFGLSGYTYYDDAVWNGMDGFVMWDRETESLWWPLVREAVSGSMKGTEMKVLPDSLWQQTTWGQIRNQFKEVQVLQPGQDFERPTSWIKYTDQSVTDSSQVPPNR